jgi:hypothetical protein
VHVANDGGEVTIADHPGPCNGTREHETGARRRGDRRAGSGETYARTPRTIRASRTRRRVGTRGLRVIDRKSLFAVVPRRSPRTRARPAVTWALDRRARIAASSARAIALAPRALVRDRGRGADRGARCGGRDRARAQVRFSPRRRL